MADPHASPAEDAEVVIAVEERIIFPYFKIAVKRRQAHFLNVQGFHNVLKLTTTIVRAQHAAGRFPDFADSGFVLIALIFLAADQTGIRMFGKD
jgi:hypothetical protein